MGLWTMVMTVPDRFPTEAIDCSSIPRSPDRNWGQPIRIFKGWWEFLPQELRGRFAKPFNHLRPLPNLVMRLRPSYTAASHDSLHGVHQHIFTFALVQGAVFQSRVMADSSVSSNEGSSIILQNTSQRNFFPGGTVAYMCSWLLSSIDCRG
jgi:hypothetical protein